MKNIFVLLLLLCASPYYAQQAFNGTARYQTESAMSVTVDSSAGMSADQQRALNERLNRAMQKEYELLFSGTESLYRELPDLTAEGGVEVIGVGHGLDGGLYKNTAEKKLVETRDAFGKLFLIEDELSPLEWQLQAEQKMIGDYRCHKAVVFADRPGEEEVVAITAWYTTQIPINQGPASYWGLPGFILEVDNGRLLIRCTELTLATGEPIEIPVPSKGKKVGREAYKKRYNAKVAEMQRMYETRREKSN